MVKVCEIGTFAVCKVAPCVAGFLQPEPPISDQLIKDTIRGLAETWKVAINKTSGVTSQIYLWVGQLFIRLDFKNGIDSVCLPGKHILGQYSYLQITQFPYNCIKYSIAESNYDWWYKFDTLSLPISSRFID